MASVVNFGCSGSWAYANVTEGTGSAAIDAVIVLQSQGSGWVVADRANACNNHLVPSDLYTKRARRADGPPSCDGEPGKERP